MPRCSKTYSQIINNVLTCSNLLPPSGAMAGVYTVNDNLNGVWNAPANTSIVGAARLPIRLTDAQQADLNVDAVSGKSINAIRFFNGQGILIWGGENPGWQQPGLALHLGSPHHDLPRTVRETGGARVCVRTEHGEYLGGGAQ